MSTVLGYCLTEQMHHDSRRELERGARELREDVAMFQPTEPAGNRTPVPFLVNPQMDTPPTYSCQTIKCTINFARDSDFWRDDTASLLHQHQAAAMQMKREFQYADGHQTAATSELASMQGTFVAELVSPDDIVRIREEALASRKKPSAALGEDKTEEEKKKEGEDETHME